MSGLLPFWSSVFREVDWSVRPLLQLRSPLEVALSLNRRNGIPLSRGSLIWLRHVLDAEAGTREMRRAVLDWSDFLGDRKRTLERVGEQLDLTWPRWSDSALTEIDEFVSADLKHEVANEEDLRVHPAISDLVRETNAAMVELVKDPTDIRVWGRLDDIRARFEDAAAIFGHAMFEWEEESRRVQSLAMRERDERAAELVAGRDQFAALQNEFAGQLAAMQNEFAGQLAAMQNEFAGQLIAVRSDFSSQLAATRDEFVSQLSIANREARHGAERMDEADRELARAEDIVAYLADRHAQKRRKGTRTRLRDYWRFTSKVREELDIIRSSIFFNEEYYLDMNPDVRAAAVDAALHSLTHGGRKGRDPGPFFSTSQYLMQYPDVAASVSMQSYTMKHTAAVKRGRLPRRR